MIRITLLKSYFRDGTIQPMKLGSRILLKAIYRLLELAHHIFLLSNIPKRLLHIDLLKVTIKEGILHIQLKHQPLMLTTRENKTEWS